MTKEIGREELLSGLTLLGQNVRQPVRKLETFPNQHPGRRYWVTLVTDEFTCLCAATGQPDFATITIRYVPDQRIVESKSLKLYLWSFRDEGHFHEHVTNRILDDLAAATKLHLSVINQVLEIMRREKLVEVKGATSYATESYTFKVTELGQKRGSELIEICRYVGPAPVVLEDYQQMVELQIAARGIRDARVQQTLDEFWRDPVNRMDANLETLDNLQESSTVIKSTLEVSGPQISHLVGESRELVSGARKTVAGRRRSKAKK